MKNKKTFIRKGTVLFAVIISVTTLITSCVKPPTLEKSGISFDTKLLEIPTDTPWNTFVEAFEMVHPFKLTVVFEDATNPMSENPIPADRWPEFKAPFPWKKNIKRNILFDAAFMVGSPSVFKSGNVSSTDLEANLAFLDIGDYSWMELATVESVTLYPGGGKPSGQIPEPGQVIFQTVVKPQVNRWVEEIYQLTDGKGNYFVMHATEADEPSLDVALPEGWSLQRVELNEPLIITPTVDGYYNLLMDNLGQGYHQYIYADGIFNSEYFLK